MKKSSIFILCAAVIALANADLVLGASKTSTTKKQTGTNQVDTSGVSALTEGECTGLGGTVKDVTADACGSLKRCNTVDSSGVIRRVCIDKK